MVNVIKPIVLGELEGDKSGFTYMCFAGQITKLDVAIFYIEGPDKNILVDTGSYKDLMAKYWPGKGRDFQTFEEGLDSVGLSPKDIDIVIYTHLHHDHCGYHDKVSHAKAIIQEDEWIFAMAPHPLQAQFYPKELYKNMKIMLIKDDFEVAEGAKIPFHNHFYQEIVIIMSGKVKVATKGKVCLVRKGGKTEVLSKNSVVLGSGDVFYTYPWEPHSLVNEGKETVTLYCIIDCPNCRVCTPPNEFL